MDWSSYEIDPLDAPPLTPTSKEVLSQAIRAGFAQESSRMHFPQDPKLWSEWEVNHWLDWCQAKFGLQSLGPDWRGMPGSELCTLDREAFLDLSSDYTAGEILWEHLETLCRDCEYEHGSSVVLCTLNSLCQSQTNRDSYVDHVQLMDKQNHHGQFSHVPTEPPQLLTGSNRKDLTETTCPLSLCSETLTGQAVVPFSCGSFYWSVLILKWPIYGAGGRTSLR